MTIEDLHCGSAVCEEGELLQSSDYLGFQADFTLVKVVMFPEEILLENDTDL